MKRTSPQSTPEARVIRWQLVAIALVSVLVYLPSMRGGFVWDDHALLNFAQRGDGSTLWGCLSNRFLGSYYRPVVSVTLWADAKLWGGTPFLFHQTNVLLHVFGSLAVTGMLHQLVRKRAVSVLGGLLFAVQPAQASAVGWIGGRTDALFALFCTLFLWACIRNAQSPTRRTGVEMALAFALAVFTKEQGLALLPLPAIAVWLLNPERVHSRKSLLSSVTPTVLVAMAFVPLWLGIGHLETGGSAGGTMEVAARFFRSVLHYTGLLAVPMPGPLHTLSMEGLEALRYAVPLGAVLAVLWIWAPIRLRKNFPQSALLVIFSGLILLPVLNLVPMPSLLLAPYRAAAAGGAAAGLLAMAVVSATARQPKRTAVLSGALLLPLALMTGWAGAQWTSEERIYNTIVRFDPHCLIVRHNLASLHLNHGRPKRAKAELESLLTQLFDGDEWRNPETGAAKWRSEPRLSLRIRRNMGTRVQPNDGLARTMAELGTVNLMLNEAANAEAVLKTARIIAPNAKEPLIGLAACARRRGAPLEAVALLGRARQLGADAKELSGDLGAALLESGQPKAAIEPLRLALQQRPWSEEIKVRLARAEAEGGGR